MPAADLSPFERKPAMNSQSICCALFLIGTQLTPAAEPAKTSLIREFSTLIDQLALAGGFSDEDATKAAVFFLKKLLGPIPQNQMLSTRVVVSKADSVTIYAGYDMGITTQGFEFQFLRGDPARGLRNARFDSLKVIPGE